MTGSQFHTEHPQILGATVYKKSLIARAICRPRFVRPHIGGIIIIIIIIGSTALGGPWPPLEVS